MTWHMPAAGQYFIKGQENLKTAPANNKPVAPKKERALVTRPAAGKGK